MKTKLLGVVTGAIVGLMLSQASAATITLLDTYRIEQGNGWVVNNSGGIGQSLALPFTTPDKPGQIHIREVRALIVLPYYGTTGSVDIGIMANVPYHDTWPAFPFGDIPTGTFLYDTNISLTPDVGISFDPTNWKLDPNGDVPDFVEVDEAGIAVDH